MPIFKAKTRASFHCSTCARLTEHEKLGEDFSVHLPILFLSCLLWLPVWIVALLLDRSKPFLCTVCGAAAAEGGAR